MNLDVNRIRAILDTSSWFYDSGQAPVRNDARFYPGARTFIGTQFAPSMSVLDIGCGNGETLLTFHDRFETGIGIDNDPLHIDIANNEKRTRPIDNVSFHLCDVTNLGTIVPLNSIDFIISQRGPIIPDQTRVADVLTFLRPDGMLFCELIGNLHSQEAHAIFAQTSRVEQMTTTSEQMRVICERCGLSIRLVADLITKRYYPDVYAWLQFQSAVWRWLGEPLPQPDDPRIGWFAERNQTKSGEIETTHHVVWIAGVKLEGS